MKLGHHKVFTLFGGTKLLSSKSQVGSRFPAPAPPPVAHDDDDG